MNTTSLSNSSSAPPRAPPLLSVQILVGGSKWELALLIFIGTAFTLIYALVAVAIHRVSRRLHPFLLFLSEALANLYIQTFFVASYSLQLLRLPPLGGTDVMEGILGSLTSYASHLHYLLIAVNRGFAVFLPLKYDVCWTRERTLASVALVWVVGSSLEAFILIYSFISGDPKKTPSILFFMIYVYVQRVVTLPSLIIYTASLSWVLLARALLWWKQRRRIFDTNNNNSDSTAPTIGLGSADYVHAMDLRIFAYCLLSFLPNLYYIFVRPRANSLHWQLYALTRISSPGLLLFTMSSVVREQLPSCAKWGLKALGAGGGTRSAMHNIATTRANPATNHRQPPPPAAIGTTNQAKKRNMSQINNNNAKTVAIRQRMFQKQMTIDEGGGGGGKILANAKVIIPRRSAHKFDAAAAAAANETRV